MSKISQETIRFSKSNLSVYSLFWIQLNSFTSILHSVSPRSNTTYIEKYFISHSWWVVSSHYLPGNVLGCNLNEKNYSKRNIKLFLPTRLKKCSQYTISFGVVFFSKPNLKNCNIGELCLKQERWIITLLGEAPISTLPHLTFFSQPTRPRLKTSNII